MLDLPPPDLWGNSTDYAPQMWSWNATSKLVSSTAAGQIGWCVGAPPLPGVPLLVVLCNSTDSSQLFNYNASSGAFSLASEPGFCVDAGSPPPNCSAPPFSSYTYCNSSAAPADRAADLVSRLTVIDMAYVLEQTNPGIPRLGIPRVQFNEALHGVVYGCGPAFYNATTGYNSTGCPTSFPHGTLLGSTFNRSLWCAQMEPPRVMLRVTDDPLAANRARIARLRVGETISDEGRALHNTINYGIQTWYAYTGSASTPLAKDVLSALFVFASSRFPVAGPRISTRHATLAGAAGRRSLVRLAACWASRWRCKYQPCHTGTWSPCLSR